MLHFRLNQRTDSRYDLDWSLIWIALLWSSRPWWLVLRILLVNLTTSRLSIYGIILLYPKRHLKRVNHSLVMHKCLVYDASISLSELNTRSMLMFLNFFLVHFRHVDIESVSALEYAASWCAIAQGLHIYKILILHL